jgi:hypothetical protein
VPRTSPQWRVLNLPSLKYRFVPKVSHVLPLNLRNCPLFVVRWAADREWGRLAKGPLRGTNLMKKLLLALVLWGSVLCTPVFAKTFVGVLWPMFGPLPAIGLVELVAELKLMPDVEVSTYLHQSWPALVDDIERQPPGTRTVVIGYSLGANSSVFVANKAKYIDVIIALQPSMLSWNPAVTGRVGRMIEVYNPNPWMTFGGMGSKKLIGPNIEYVANNDSHPGAQFSSDFRTLVKSEIARVSAEPAVVTAQGAVPVAPALAFAEARTPAAPMAAQGRAPTVAAPMTAQTPPIQAPIHAPMPVPRPANIAGPTKLAALSQQSSSRERSHEPSHELSHEPNHGSSPQAGYASAFLESLTGAVDSGNLFAQRQLTVAAMMDYANRNYRNARTAELLPTDSEYR